MPKNPISPFRLKPPIKQMLIELAKKKTRGNMTRHIESLILKDYQS